MATVIKKRLSSQLAKKQQTECQTPKRLSKAGQWMLDNPDGMGVIVDRRAVNR